MPLDILRLMFEGDSSRARRAAADMARELGKANVQVKVLANSFLMLARSTDPVGRSFTETREAIQQLNVDMQTLQRLEKDDVKLGERRLSQMGRLGAAQERLNRLRRTAEVPTVPKKLTGPEIEEVRIRAMVTTPAGRGRAARGNRRG